MHVMGMGAPNRSAEHVPNTELESEYRLLYYSKTRLTISRSITQILRIFDWGVYGIIGDDGYSCAPEVEMSVPSKLGGINKNSLHHIPTITTPPFLV